MSIWKEILKGEPQSKILDMSLKFLHEHMDVFPLHMHALAHMHTNTYIWSTKLDLLKLSWTIFSLGTQGINSMHGLLQLQTHTTHPITIYITYSSSIIEGGSRCVLLKFSLTSGDNSMTGLSFSLKDEAIIILVTCTQCRHYNLINQTAFIFHMWQQMEYNKTDVFSIQHDIAEQSTLPCVQ